MPDDLNDAISAAVGEAKSETGVTPEVTAPEPDTTATVDTTAKVEAAEPAEPTTAKPTEPEPDEEFFNPTAEDLALIEQNPALKKAYKAFRKGFTEKTTAIARERKELGERAELAAWIQQNPEQAARRLAELSGLTIGEARSEIKEAKAAAEVVTDELSEMWKKSIGDDAAPVLRPVIEATARAVAEKLIAPFRAQTEELAAAASRRGVAASVSEFGSTVTQRGEEWNEEIQSEMAELSESVKPGEKTSIEDYLSSIYDTVMMRRSRSLTARANLKRLQRIRDESEPATPARPTSKSEERITSDMSDKDAVALAVRQTRKQLGLV